MSWIAGAVTGALVGMVAGGVAWLAMGGTSVGSLHAALAAGGVLGALIGGRP